MPTIQHIVTIQVADENEASQVRLMLDKYEFIASGLIYIGKELEIQNSLVAGYAKQLLKKKAIKI